MTNVQHDPTPDEAVGGSHMPSDEQADDAPSGDPVEDSQRDDAGHDDVTDVAQPDDQAEHGEATYVAPASGPATATNPDDPVDDVTDIQADDTAEDGGATDVSRPAGGPDDAEPYGSVDVAEPDDQVDVAESEDSTDVAERDEAAAYVAPTSDPVAATDPDDPVDLTGTGDETDTAEPYGSVDVAEPDELVVVAESEEESVDVADAGDTEVAPESVPAEPTEPEDLVPLAVAAGAAETAIEASAPSDDEAEGPAPALAEDPRWTDRWKEIQIGFVDEPRRAMESADTLVGEVLDELTVALAAERARLHRQWTSESEPSTEELRLAFQRYRDLFDRLLAT